MHIIQVLEKNQFYLPYSDEPESELAMVTFCRGSPGVIPMLMQAAYLFPNSSEKILNTAKKVGDLIWKKGILLKGNSLCHGISGNAYMLHTMFRKFNLLSKQEFHQK
jgi:hypothetical protein